MTKKTKTVFTLNFVLLSVLLCSLFTSASALERDWNVGDELYFESSYAEAVSILGVNDLPLTYTQTSTYGYEFDILDIDESLKVAQINLSIVYETVSQDYHYDATNVSNWLVDNYFNFQYHWDESTNQTRLTDVYLMGGETHIIVEPNWEAVNSILANLSNRDRIIASVSHDSTVDNVTFGDFLDSANSYGVTGIEGFPGSIESTGHEWALNFDLSNMIYEREFNSTSFEYDFTPYPLYSISSILKYSSGGTLLESTFFRVTEIEKVDGIYHSEFTISMLKDGFQTSSTSFSAYSALLTLLVVPLVFQFFKRKKK